MLYTKLVYSKIQKVKIIELNCYIIWRQKFVPQIGVYSQLNQFCKFKVDLTFYFMVELMTTY